MSNFIWEDPFYKDDKYWAYQAIMLKRTNEKDLCVYLLKNIYAMGMERGYMNHISREQKLHLRESENEFICDALKNKDLPNRSEILAKLLDKMHGAEAHKSIYDELLLLRNKLKDSPEAS